MIEMIMGTSGKGKTGLAFDRAFSECNDHDNFVVVFSYQYVLDWITPQLEFDFLLRNSMMYSCLPYQKFSMFGIDSGYTFKEIAFQTRKVIQDMCDALCWPDVIVMDFNWPLESFKWISELEAIYPDKLFIITVKQEEYVNHLKDYNLCKLLKDKEGI